MHHSIASATYRGFARGVNQQHETLEQRVTQALGQLPKTRAAWLRHTLRVFHKLPGVTVLSESVEGEGKRAAAELVTFGYVHDAAPPHWQPVLVTLTARDMRIHTQGWPLKITAHAVERLMQRLDIIAPKTALAALKITIDFITWIDTPRPDDPPDGRLLPVFEPSTFRPTDLSGPLLGAAIIKPDQDAPEEWVMVTFVDGDKLHPEQYAELAQVVEAVKARMAEEAQGANQG
jgi:hypothetical protein